MHFRLNPHNSYMWAILSLFFNFQNGGRKWFLKMPKITSSKAMIWTWCPHSLTTKLFKCLKSGTTNLTSLISRYHGLSGWFSEPNAVSLLLCAELELSCLKSLLWRDRFWHFMFTEPYFSTRAFSMVWEPQDPCLLCSPLYTLLPHSIPCLCAVPSP